MSNMSEQQQVQHDNHHSSVPVGMPSFTSLEHMYEESTAQIEALLTSTDDDKKDLFMNPWRQSARLITALSNVSSVLFYNMNAQYTQKTDAPLHRLPINWCGFYLLDRPDRLALSTFQGKVACQHIKLGKGMCGKSVLTNTDLAIEDVLSEPGHIACDAASLSEMVVCIREPQSGRAVGCLDIDSAVKGRFTAKNDLAPLRKICDLITKHLGTELTGLMGGVSSGSIARAAAPPAAASATTTNTFTVQKVPSSNNNNNNNLMQTSITAVRINPGGQLTPLTTGAMVGAKMPMTSAVTSAASAPKHLPPNVVTSTTKCSSSSSCSSSSCGNGEKDETGQIIKHKNWELRYRCVNEMLNSSKMSVLEESLGVRLLPEIIFGLNEIHFVMEHDGAAVKPLKFRVCAQTSLQNVVEYSATDKYKLHEKESLYPVESASWTKQRKEFTTFDPKVDWAFRNNYMGLWSDANGTPTEIKEVTPEQACPDDCIDYDLLRDTTLPIRFFAAIDLWEDDLHDSGISKMSAKTRVMDPCFFVLVRHVLRVDGVRMQVRDTRHFHKFGTRKVCIEESVKGLDIGRYLEGKKASGLTSEELHRTLMTSQVEQLDMLKEESKKNYVIQF